MSAPTPARHGQAEPAKAVQPSVRPSRGESAIPPWTERYTLSVTREDTLREAVAYLSAKLRTLPAAGRNARARWVLDELNGLADAEARFREGS